MVAATDRTRPDSSSYLQNILDAPEHSGLRRLTGLVEHLFQVPVAYMALLGTGDTVVARIGNGTEYAGCLGELRLDNLLAESRLVRDSACDLPPGTDFADLRFAASAVLRSSSGVHLGILVIADRVPRPEFSAGDFRALGDLAGILAGRMELRAIASLALESVLSLRETEQRFRGIADCAPVPLIYSHADGSCLFVNRTWLDFSGRTVAQELAALGQPGSPGSSPPGGGGMRQGVRRPSNLQRGGPAAAARWPVPLDLGQGSSEISRGRQFRRVCGLPDRHRGLPRYFRSACLRRGSLPLPAASARCRGMRELLRLERVELSQREPGRRWWTAGIGAEEAVEWRDTRPNRR